MAGVAKPESTNNRIAKHQQPSHSLVTGSDKATARALPLPNPPLSLREKAGGKSKSTVRYANGNSSVKIDPPPGLASYQRSPPIARALCLASDNPSPVDDSPCVGVDDNRT